MASYVDKLLVYNTGRAREIDSGDTVTVTAGLLSEKLTVMAQASSPASNGEITYVTSAGFRFREEGITKTLGLQSTPSLQDVYNVGSSITLSGGSPLALYDSGAGTAAISFNLNAASNISVSGQALTIGSDTETNLSTPKLRIGGLGIPQTQVQVGTKAVDDNFYSYDPASVMVIHPTPTSNTALNDPLETLLLVREGSNGESYAAAAAFELSRYEDNGSFWSATRLDIKLANEEFLTNNPVRVMTWLSKGAVGINQEAPYNATMHIRGAAGSPTAVLQFEGTGTSDIKDVRLDSTDGAMRFMASPNAQTGTPDSPCLQLWGNTSSFAGQMYLDSGSHNSAAIIFRTGTTGVGITERMRIAGDGTITMTQPAWTLATPNTGGGWSHYSGTEQAACYKTAHGWVECRGSVKKSTSAASGNVFMNLPSGYRPQRDCSFVVAASGGWARVSVGTNGDCVVWDFNGAPGSFMYVNNIRFDTRS